MSVRNKSRPIDAARERRIARCFGAGSGARLGRGALFLLGTTLRAAVPDAEPDERAPDGGAANATTLAQLRDAVAKTMRARAAAAAEEARPVAPTIAIARAEPDDAAARLRASFRAAVATETERRLTAADPAVAIAAAGPREPIVLAARGQGDRIAGDEYRRCGAVAATGGREGRGRGQAAAGLPG